MPIKSNYNLGREMGNGMAVEKEEKTADKETL